METKEKKEPIVDLLIKIEKMTAKRFGLRQAQVFAKWDGEKIIITISKTI